MSDDNLVEFMEERVLPTRPIHRLNYPVEADEPLVGVWFDCEDDQTAAVILPTFAEGVLHLEAHFFADGERVDPEVTIPDVPDGSVELTLRKPVR